MKTNLDFMAGGKGAGDVANYMQRSKKLEPARLRPYLGSDNKSYISIFKGGDVEDPKNYSAIQVNADATLRPDEWKQLDDALIQVAQERLTGFDFLVSKGLSKDLPNAMGTTVLEWGTVSDSQEATRSMDAVTRGQGDRVQYKQNLMPIPIMHVDYEIGERELLVSRNKGNGIDVEEAKNAARRIREMKEDALFSTDTYTWGGGSLYSFLNFPHRSTYTIPLAWDNASKTGALILTDVVAMKNLAIADYHYGPWALFIPTLYDAILDEDYNVSGASIMSIRNRLMQVSGVDDIVTVDRLPANTVLLVQMATDTVEVLKGVPMQNVQWQTEAGWVNKFKVLEITVQRIFQDYNERSGIVHGSV